MIIKCINKAFLCFIPAEIMYGKPVFLRLCASNRVSEWFFVSNLFEWFSFHFAYQSTQWYRLLLLISHALPNTIFKIIFDGTTNKRKKKTNMPRQPISFSFRRIQIAFVNVQVGDRLIKNKMLLTISVAADWVNSFKIRSNLISISISFKQNTTSHSQFVIIGK